MKIQNASHHNRQEIDPIFKEVMTFCFGQLDVLLQTQVEVSRLPRTIDALVVLKPNQVRERVRQNTPFAHFRVYNALEFKGVRDTLTVDGYHLIVGRAHLYVGENQIDSSEMTVTMICARKPRQVFQQIQFQALENGYYLRAAELPIYLIVINELQIEAKNYPLLLFASSASKFQDFLRYALAQENFDYLRYAYTVRPQATKEVLSMTGKYSLPRKNLEFIVNDIGEELLPFFRKEALLQHIRLKDVLEYLNTQEKQRQLSDEERELLKQLLEKHEQTQVRK